MASACGDGGERMEYPLMIQGERRGSLSVELEGLYTRMEVWTEDNGELWRIWVHGGGEAGYLGVLQPWSGGMYLRRRLSRRELETFPKEIEYASDEPAAEVGRRITEPVPESAASGRMATECAESIDRDEPTPEELLWFRRPDGSLTAFNGHCNLIALPASLRHSREGAVLRQINGEEYMVFRY